jgi:hypothetical protein
MAGRGPQSFKKRQREQARKEKQEEKRAKRLQPKEPGAGPEVAEGNPILEELEAMDAVEDSDPGLTRDRV